jgi:hypothetical protein
MVLFGSLVVLVTGSRMALAGTDAGSTCTLVVPADPLSAKGLATPYEMLGPCHETNPDTAAFVQATIVDPATGAVAVYDPLVVDRGKVPAVAPSVPKVPAGAVVGVWFGFNGDDLRLRGTGDSLTAGQCVGGLGKSRFGQFAYCNAPAFFSAASTAIAGGKLAVPGIGTAADGQPCPTTRDFSLVDADQSDNVTSTYLFLPDGTTAQNTAGNEAALSTMGAQILVNGSDNALLDDFVDPALGCTPYTAPDLSQPGRVTTSLALNELQASKFQPAPAALVPVSDPMTVVDGKNSIPKTNLYRVGVGQPAIGAADTATAYCSDIVDIGPARVQLDRRLTRRAKSPDTGAANSLFTFLAQRLAGSFDTLGCDKLLKQANPVKVVTDKNGVAVDATFAKAKPPATTPAPTVSASGPAGSPKPGTSASPVTPTPSGSAGSATPTPSGSAGSSTPTPSHSATSPKPGRSAPQTGPATATWDPGTVPTSGHAATTPTGPAGHSTTGHATTTGNSTAGNSTADNSTDENSTAGNSTAGNSTAGNSTAGDTAAGANPNAGIAAGGHVGATPANPSTGASGAAAGAPSANGSAGPPAAMARSHHTAVNAASGHGYAMGAALAASGALLTAGAGVGIARGRRRPARVHQWRHGLDYDDIDR